MRARVPGPPPAPRVRAARTSGRDGSAPAFVDTGLGCLAALLRQAGIVGVALLAATVIRAAVVGIQGCAQPQPQRKIRVGDELASECNRIGPSFAEPLLGGIDF